MAMEYCHAGDHYIDLDWNCDGEYNSKDEWKCGDCIAEDKEE